MELIKQIKQAENQAKEIIEQAKASAIKQAEALKLDGQEKLAQAQEQRKKAISEAEAKAEKAGLGEAEKLKEQSKKQREKLEAGARGKMGKAVEKVMAYLKSL